ncbi:WLM-domain-containing protein [Ascobolus immersus RN42]|uniref:WLM-domain-containing protein n=1 Tax=Ascobolus immersus RN42 TaxID=1160509 RepID=A0A3N4IEJ6_ASCIM|nr:WLM-domain-containing protein [Ascobolus immersus RN42]
MCDASDINMADEEHPSCTSAPNDPPQTSANDETTDTEETIPITVSHSGTITTFNFPPDSTLSDLITHISELLSIPITPTSIKLLAPKLGLLKDPTLPLTTLTQKKLTLLTTSPQKLDAMNTALAASQTALARRAAARRKARTAHHPRSLDPTRMQKEMEESKYTFHSLRPLPHLPDPSRSLKFLERIRDDPGIKHIMRLHRYSVPILTEMDPAEHTRHDGKTLGLNRNGGEIIELRLWTDDFSGYRDFKTVRKTAIHELAHNEYSEHDANFWALFRQLEKECESGDWSRGGRQVGGKVEFYEPGEGGGEEADERAYRGGVYVLGGGSTGKEQGGEELSPRERAARAAEERMKAAREGKKGGA